MVLRRHSSGRRIMESFQKSLKAGLSGWGLGRFYCNVCAKGPKDLP